MKTERLWHFQHTQHWGALSLALLFTPGGCGSMVSHPQAM